MTQLGQSTPHAQQLHGQVPAAGVTPGMLAPGRAIHQIIQKGLPDGREFSFDWKLRTIVVPPNTYATWELVNAPTLDCSCTPQFPDDIIWCIRCFAAVCMRRHSRTCAGCGNVFCSRCLRGVTVYRTRAIVCRPCGDHITASPLKRAWTTLKRTVWGI